MKLIYMFMRAIQLVLFMVFFVVWLPVAAVGFLLCAVLSLVRFDLIYYHIWHGRWSTDEEHRKMDDMFFEGFTTSAKVPALLFFGRKKKKYVI